VNRNILVCLIGLALALVVVVALNQHRSQPDPKYADARWEQRTSAPDSTEAMTWLKLGNEANRRLAGGNGQGPTYEQSVALVKQLYDAGAAKVFAVAIKKLGVIEESDSLVVLLPYDPNKRKQLFSLESTFAKQRGWDAEPDVGQTYLLFWWD
jgi:hypothetical protein